MRDSAFWSELLRMLEVETEPRQVQGVGGGDINASYLVTTDDEAFFIKLNGEEYGAMFSTEAEALLALADTQTCRVPTVYGTGSLNGRAYLALESLSLGPATDSGAHRTLGEQVAALHRNEVADNRFGWHTDNFIGTTPQPNHRTATWWEFWRDQRLAPQIDLALENGFHELTDWRRPLLDDAVEAMLGDHQPPASLVHGDLWSGNYAFVGEQPVLYDPAAYYGDREVDIAMTEMFGGFTPAFYEGYHATWPLDPGYQTRKPLYNLYHQLNHLNLFGRGYLGGCLGCIAKMVHGK